MNIRETEDGECLYIDPAAFLARGQVFAAKKAFTTEAGDPAWRCPDERVDRRDARPLGQSGYLSTKIRLSNSLICGKSTSR